MGKLISQMTANELFDLIRNCAFKSPADEFIGKPQTIDLDGPAGFTNSTVRKSDDVYDTCFYCSESVLGATWNQDLAYAMGESIGNEGLVGDESASRNTYNGLYAPGVNLHRPPSAAAIRNTTPKTRCSPARWRQRWFPARTARASTAS